MIVLVVSLPNDILDSFCANTIIPREHKRQIPRRAPPYQSNASCNDPAIAGVSFCARADGKILRPKWTAPLISIYMPPRRARIQIMNSPRLYFATYLQRSNGLNWERTKSSE